MKEKLQKVVYKGTKSPNTTSFPVWGTSCGLLANNKCT